MATLSEIQNRRVTLKGVKRTQTIRVRVKGENGASRCIINVRDFNEDLHEKLSDEDTSTADVAGKTALELENTRAAAAAKAVAAAKRVTPLTRAELSTMSMEALRLTPEWANIPAGKRNKLKDKEAAVEAIINARKVAGR